MGIWGDVAVCGKGVHGVTELHGGPLPFSLRYHRVDLPCQPSQRAFESSTRYVLKSQPARRASHVCSVCVCVDRELRPVKNSSCVSLCIRARVLLPHILPASHRSLEKLALDSCNLVSIKLSVPKLKELSVRGCPSLAELEARCWQLSRLDMGPSESFGLLNANLAKLTITSGALRHMEWIKLQ